MHAEKVQIKIFSSGQPDVPSYLSVFQRWIRDHVLDELLIDVVDYSHVPDGPEVTLIGHNSDYVFDRTGGRLGLLYASKRQPESMNGPYLSALKRSVSACLLLEKEPGPPVPVAFRSDELFVRIADRLNAPNTEETFNRVAPALSSALARFYGTTAFSLSRVGSPRELFGIEVRAPSAPPLGELLPRLADSS
jgi:hypothetical protein